MDSIRLIDQLGDWKLGNLKTVACKVKVTQSNRSLLQKASQANMSGGADARRL